jgi:hypothetical protein
MDEFAKFFLMKNDMTSLLVNFLDVHECVYFVRMLTSFLGGCGAYV